MFFKKISCTPFVKFIQHILLDLLSTGAISLVGKVGSFGRPDLVLSLTVEPTKPWLCHNARYLNLWSQGKLFSLDHVRDLPRYVSKDHYHTVKDDNSGYDHIQLKEVSQT